MSDSREPYEKTIDLDGSGELAFSLGPRGQFLVDGREVSAEKALEIHLVTEQWLTLGVFRSMPRGRDEEMFR